MSSRQLQDLTPQELLNHAFEISRAAREALAAARRERRGVAAAIEQAARAEAADMALELPEMEEMEDAESLTNAAAAAHERAEVIAKLDILHRQQMMGEWSRDINAALINEQTKKAVELVTKQELKKHMGSMLGDWDKAGKLSKRRVRKTKTKTKRRRQKITKRRRRK